MPPTEYFSWTAHFSNNPPLERVVPVLLAQLCTLVFNAHFKDETGTPRTLEHYAPWTVTPEEKAKREEEKEEQELIFHAAMLAEAYERKKQNA